MCRFLRRNRLVRKGHAGDAEKARRTNRMLVGITLAFCVCWAPINVFNVVADATDVFKVSGEISFIPCARR